MVDFLMIAHRNRKGGVVEIYPKFRVDAHKDLMIRGRDFYAVWDQETQLWTTDENCLIHMVDRELDRHAEEFKKTSDSVVHVMHMWDSESGSIDSWHRYVQRQLRDNYHPLDEKITFAGTKTTREDYVSRRLSYPLQSGETPGYDKLMSTLYLPEERHKLEWAIGSIISGDSKNIQKFIVLYGSAGTGKSTILNIIQMLFEGYYATFDAHTLGSSNSTFALEQFRSNPLVAIQHDGDLSRIEDNTRLNSLVSHELMTVNEKFKSTYSARFNSFLFMGTNKPVRITDAKSGLIRRLIDVYPSGQKLPRTAYDQAFGLIKFELGAIAQHCLDVYLDNPGFYDSYVPVNMMGATNNFYNYILEASSQYESDDGVSLKKAWEDYKAFNDKANITHGLTYTAFREELKNYFDSFNEDRQVVGERRVRNYYSGFRLDKLRGQSEPEPAVSSCDISLLQQPSILDDVCSNCLAQYASAAETPLMAWAKVQSTLKQIDTSKVHYVKLPENHIVIDFDLKVDGHKDLAKNLEAASKWPKTYTEVSKGGSGLHLHYIYDGDPALLMHEYDTDIEIKIFTGGSSLRRRLTLCNNLPIAKISTGLPLREAKVRNKKDIADEKHLIRCIEKGLRREVWDHTKPSVDYIHEILEQAYEAGFPYDVSGMRDAIRNFCEESHNQSDYCLKMFQKMKWKSADTVEPTFVPYSMDSSDLPSEATITFFDIEVKPNLTLVCWKFIGPNHSVIRMYNPTAEDIELLIDNPNILLVGFNNLEYDNHILHALSLGMNVHEIYLLSQRLIANDPTAKFKNAKYISYTDVFDFATKKQSLKKWEIELGIHHQEMGIPWDEPIPESKWEELGDYCENDVLATEAVFNARKGDFMARQIQVELVKKMHGITNVSVNDTTNQLSGKLIFGRNYNPQHAFNWRDLSKPVTWDQYQEYVEKFGEDYVFHIFDRNGLPTGEIYDDLHTGKFTVLPEGYSILPFFPRYRFSHGKSYWFLEHVTLSDGWEQLVENGTYVEDRDYYIIGEGGRVYAKPGMYGYVWDGDIKSQHPHSAIAEVLFGPTYTAIFRDIVYARVAIKEKRFDDAAKMLNGVLVPYLSEEYADDLAQALKIVINSVYGLTSAKFQNIFRDQRNVDNIVAKRGALFMCLLSEEVQKRGFTVAHIKTDSIKIPNATPGIRQFVNEFGEYFGYSFDTEYEFDRFGLANKAIYIARVAEGKKKGQWIAVGDQFQEPYVFKTLFSKEPIEFADMCCTKATKSALYLDYNESLADTSAWEKELAKLQKKQENPERQTWLRKHIIENHDYQFIGKVGLFTPVKPNLGGGLLVRTTNTGGYAAVQGTTGYRWLESEMIPDESYIDKSYFDTFVAEAKQTLMNLGDFEWFISTEEDNQQWPPEDDLPWVV